LTDGENQNKRCGKTGESKDVIEESFHDVQVDSFPVRGPFSLANGRLAVLMNALPLVLGEATISSENT
jgi:hypothetical protein